MKKSLITLLIFIGTIALIFFGGYMIGSFIEVSFSLKEWSYEIRFAVGCWIAAISIFACAIVMMIRFPAPDTKN